MVPDEVYFAERAQQGEQAAANAFSIEAGKAHLE
jgi:hypothetical protein